MRSFVALGCRSARSRVMTESHGVRTLLAAAPPSSRPLGSPAASHIAAWQSAQTAARTEYSAQHCSVVDDVADVLERCGIIRLQPERGHFQYAGAARARTLTLMPDRCVLRWCSLTRTSPVGAPPRRAGPWQFGSPRSEVLRGGRLFERTVRLGDHGVVPGSLAAECSVISRTCCMSSIQTAFNRPSALIAAKIRPATSCCRWRLRSRTSAMCG